MTLLARVTVLALALLLSGCLSPPPANESLRARLPGLFNDDDSSYVVVIKPSNGGAAVEQRITFDGEGPSLIRTQEALVWKVASGVHFVTYSMWLGGGTMRVEVFEGDRVVVAVDGGGGMVLQSYINDREALGSHHRLAGYYDHSNRIPPEPLRRRR